MNTCGVLASGSGVRWNVWSGERDGVRRFMAMGPELIPPVDWDLGEGAIYVLHATFYLSKEAAVQYAKILTEQAKYEGDSTP